MEFSRATHLFSTEFIKNENLLGKSRVCADKGFK